MHGIGQLGRAAHGEDKGLEVVALYVDILQVPVFGEIDRVQFAFAQPKLLQIGELSKVFVGADLEHIGAVLREDQRLERIGLCFRYVSVVVRIALEECPPLHALVCKGKRLRYGIGRYEKTGKHNEQRSQFHPSLLIWYGRSCHSTHDAGLLYSLVEAQ